MTNIWDSYFDIYIASYKEYNQEYNATISQTSYSKYITDWIRTDNIIIMQSKYDNNYNQMDYMIFKNNSIPNVFNIDNNILDKININTIASQNIKYFIEYHDKIYRIIPDFIECETRYKYYNFIKKADAIKFLVSTKPYTASSGTHYIAKKINGVIVKYSNNLLRYEFIKKFIFNLDPKSKNNNNNNNNNNLEKKFNKFKFSKVKINESNNKIIKLLSHTDF